MKKLLSILLILIGLGVILYSPIKTKYYEYKQDKILSSWEEAFLAVDSIETDTEITIDIDDDISISSIDLLKQSVHAQKSLNDNELTYDPSDYNQESISENENYVRENIEGILIIDSIDLKLPIVRGASAENMLITVTSFDNTAIAGEVGNYAIIGHRNLTYGRNFNRLGEMEIGDEIKVITDKGTYTYTVYDIFLVLPDDVGVLFGTNLEKRITLITCDPMGNPTHRLIIRGKIIE